MPPSIAIVGLACVYPDARTPGELWENVLAQRRSFRRLPSERIRREDYFSSDKDCPDHAYSLEGAVIEGYQFDRVSFRVAGSTFRSADLAHWLALDVAGKALADAGFPEGRGLPRDATGVLLGNTLTGEFSRANVLRLRWPYVRRVVESALMQENWPDESRARFMARLEADFKSPFPPVGEESLAGGLSNTIAGRICNQFDLRGGGYTLDGACASSLLAIANACAGLTNGDLDLALAGGVDLSLDPFELVGFAKTGALATDEMRVFDRRSAGFWPGEGCGFVVLMRHEDALAQGCRVYALIRGWGISSDGSGGITRPEADGQLEALRRAYRRAGFGIETVSLCEAHGTGTAVGDATELAVLGRARQEARPGGPAAAVGSIKANIGHTKAAAGVAGVIKAAMALQTQVLPPTTGCEQPHPSLLAAASPLRVLTEPELWPSHLPLRASVSAMGFGGINAHLVLESTVTERRQALSPRERSLSRSAQDAELFLLAAPETEQLLAQIEGLLRSAEKLSRSELADLSATLQRGLKPGHVRAALVASRPLELAERLRTLKAWLKAGPVPRFRSGPGIFLGSGRDEPRLAFLFPGQGSPMHLDGGIWRRRFECVRQLYAQENLPLACDSVSTHVMQPAIVTAALAGLRVLNQFGVAAGAAVGHSLGEFVAAHWAGAVSEEALLRIVRVRGQAMADLGIPTGAMLAVAAPWLRVQELLRDTAVSIVGYNSPRQTVVAGEAGAINEVAKRAAAAGCQATPLAVSHAFHTPLVAAAVPRLAEQLARESFAPLRHPVLSTVTGGALEGHENLGALFCRQVTSPVRFTDALAGLLHRPPAGAPSDSGASSCGLSPELLIEVGPGSILTGLAQDSADVPALALDACGPSLAGLLQVLGASFALGAPLKLGLLYADRFTRPFALNWKPAFFTNPCEQHQVRNAECAMVDGEECGVQLIDCGVEEEQGNSVQSAECAMECRDLCALDLVRHLVADRAELPAAAVQDEHRMLSDLHLNSITVGQLVSESARRLGLPRLAGSTDFANATIAEIAGALEELKRSGRAPRPNDSERQPPGVDIWFQTFVTEWVDAKRPIVAALAVGASSGWQLFAPSENALVASLRQRMPTAGGNGVIVCLQEIPSEDDVKLLLAAARAVRGMPGEARFVVVQHGWGGGGFARTLHLETGLRTCVLNVPPGHPQAADWIMAEALSADGFVEAHYDAGGRRREARLKWLHDPEPSAPWPLGPGDVLLATGGGKGIGAECALALGRETGAGLAILGRAKVESDPELAENLARINAAGVRCVYVRADVTDAAAVKAAVAEAESRLGPVTALLHGAGTNTPQLIEGLDEAAFRRTLAPKLQGVRNVLAALAPERLRLFITFGSIIARAGLRGEADYATANEWLTAFTEQYQAQNPKCRCLALEWSVWSGVGMGERLGRVDSLIQQGIMPIPPDEGVRLLLESVRRPNGPVALVITGRFGVAPTLKMSEPELPLRRFLERQRAFYPGVELIVDTHLSAPADLYLDDHILQKQRLFPAVMGLEAMAQAAMALTGSSIPPDFEQVALTRPVAVSDRATTAIRLAALRRGPDLVEVCLRSEETDFHVDHFRALCRFGVKKPSTLPAPAGTAIQGQPISLGTCVNLDPAEDLYGRILFHRGRFRRLRGYRLLQATECIAELVPDQGGPWFGPYLPGEFVLGDPGARDTALHAIQASIPHRRILPTGIDRLSLWPHLSPPRFISARQRRREGGNFVYDVEVTDEMGALLERWEGLRLRAVEPIAPPAVWPEALLGPYLERCLEELAPHANLRLVLEGGPNGARRSSSDAALQKALGGPHKIWRRPDGKPMATEQAGLSAAHALNLTLGISAAVGTACDMEAVTKRPANVWRDLLGDDRFQLVALLVREQGESTELASTRVWTTFECLKKAGLPLESPLVFASATAEGWILLRSGGLDIFTYAAAIRGLKTQLVFAFALARARIGQPVPSLAPAMA